MDPDAIWTGFFFRALLNRRKKNCGVDQSTPGCCFWLYSLSIMRIWLYAGANDYISQNLRALPPPFQAMRPHLREPFPMPWWPPMARNLGDITYPRVWSKNRGLWDIVREASSWALPVRRPKVRGTVSQGRPMSREGFGCRKSASHDSHRSISW